MKILIVDPDPNRQRQLRTILASLGHKSGDVESSTDVKTARASLKKKKSDFIFVGLFEGAESIALIKELRTGSTTKTMPSIAYSTEVTKESVVSAAEAGASSFLAYPFSVSDVESAMKTAIAKAS